MKEIELKKTDNLEISIKQKKQVEKKLINQIMPHEGHTIWEINNETLEINKANFLNSTFYVLGENKKEILVRNNCTYISALTKKTAFEKFKKGVNGSKYINPNPLKL